MRSNGFPSPSRLDLPEKRQSWSGPCVEEERPLPHPPRPDALDEPFCRRVDPQPEVLRLCPATKEEEMKSAQRAREERRRQPHLHLALELATLADLLRSQETRKQAV